MGSDRDYFRDTYSAFGVEMIITWCKCQRHILTTKQIEDKLPCEQCQREHAERLKERLDKLNENTLD